MRICAPFAGIVHYAVAAGEHVDTGAELATVEAVKLEAPVLAPGPGVVTHVELADFSNVSGGDTLLSIDPLPEDHFAPEPHHRSVSREALGGAGRGTEGIENGNPGQTDT